MRSSFKRSILTLIFASVFMASIAYAVDESWKPAQPGSPYTVTLKDEAGTTVTGEFTTEVTWEQKANGKLKIKKWDKNATFKYTGDDGKEHKVKNATVKNRLVSMNADLTGTLKGDIKVAPKKFRRHHKKSAM